MMGLETLNQRPTDLRAHPESPIVAMSALPGDDVQHVNPLVQNSTVSRTGSLASLISAEWGECLGDANARAFVRRHFAEPQTLAVEHSNGAPGQVVGAAMLMISGGQFSEACRILQTASERTTDYWVHHYLGLALWRDGQRDSAKAIFGKLLDDRISDFRPRHALGRIFLSEGLWSDAIEMLRGATERPHATASVYADLGAALLQVSNVRDAISVSRTALAKDARLALALNNLGVCYLINGDQRRAKSQFVQAVALEPGCRAAIDNLVELHIANEDWASAEVILSGYLDRNAHDELAIERLAWIKLATNSLTQAKRLLEQAVKLQHAGAPAWNNLAIVHVKMGAYVAAESAFQKAIVHAPDDMRIRVNYARVLAAHDRHSAVLSALPAQGALSNVEASVLRSNALAQRPASGDVLEFVRTAYARFPGNSDLQTVLGYVLTSVFGRLDEALTVLRQGAKEHPSHVGLSNNLAYALIKSGDLTEARRVLEPFVRLIGSTSPGAVFVTASWGLLRIREDAFDDGIQFYRIACEHSSGRTRARLEQKILVEEARRLLAVGDRYNGNRKAKQALSSAQDPEFTEEARQLQSSERTLN